MNLDYFALCFFSFFIYLTNSNSLFTEDCGNGELLELRASVCKTSPCKITKNKPYHVEMDFVPKTDADQVEFKLSASLYGFSFDIPVDNTDACGQGLIKCPLKANEKTTFIYKGHVDSSVPTISTTLEINLYSNESSIVCARTDVELMDEEEHIEL